MKVPVRPSVPSVIRRVSSRSRPDAAVRGKAFPGGRDRDVRAHQRHPAAGQRFADRHTAGAQRHQASRAGDCQLTLRQDFDCHAGGEGGVPVRDHPQPRRQAHARREQGFADRRARSVDGKALRGCIRDEREGVRAVEMQVQVRHIAEEEVRADLRAIPEEAVARVEPQPGIQQDVPAETLEGGEGQRLREGIRRQADLRGTVDRHAHPVADALVQTGEDPVAGLQGDPRETQETAHPGGPGGARHAAAVDEERHGFRGARPEKQGPEEDHHGSGKDPDTALFHKSILIQNRKKPELFGKEARTLITKRRIRQSLVIGYWSIVEMAPVP